MKGFNYSTQASFDLPVSTLREDARKIITAGGYRRVENGETFIHGADGKLVWEAYGNVTVGKQSEQHSLLNDAQ